MSTHYVTAHIECAGIEIELDIECDVTHLGEPAGHDDPGCGPEYDMTIRSKLAGIVLDYDRDLTDEQRGIVDDAISDASASWAEDEEHDMAKCLFYYEGLLVAKLIQEMFFICIHAFWLPRFVLVFLQFCEVTG